MIDFVVFLEYSTLKDLYTALVNSEIDGIMLDVFKASYSSNHIKVGDPQDLVIAKIFEFPFMLGFYYPMPSNQINLEQCLRAASKKSFQAEVYHSVRKYVRGAALKVGQRCSAVAQAHVTCQCL